MKWKNYMTPGGKLPLRFLFLAGFLTGVLIAYFGRHVFLTNTSLLREEALYRIKYMALDNRFLFWAVLSRRLKNFIIPVIMATTYLGLVFCGGLTVKYGFSMGFFVSTAIYRYGVKGIFLGMVGIFPHYLCYVPAMLLLLRWCEDIYRSIYFYHNITGQGKKSLPGKLGKLICVLCIFVFGCVLECFVNPGLLKGFLQSF